MTYEEHARWVETIEEQLDLVQSRAIEPNYVSRLASEAIARARVATGETRWLEYSLKGIGAGLTAYVDSVRLGRCDLSGLGTALRYCMSALIPFDRIHPFFRAPAEGIDRMIEAYDCLGITDRRAA